MAAVGVRAKLERYLGLDPRHLSTPLSAECCPEIFNSVGREEVQSLKSRGVAGQKAKGEKVRGQHDQASRIWPEEPE